MSFSKSKQGHNSRTEKIVKSEIELGLPDLVNKFQVEFNNIEWKLNQGRTDEWTRMKLNARDA